MPALAGVSLFIADPPYNLGFKYGPVKDRLKPEAYRALLAELLQSTHKAAADGASLFLINYPEILARHWDTLTQNGWSFHQWITWVYRSWTFGKPHRFRRSSRTVLWLTKGKPVADTRADPQPYCVPTDARVRRYQERSGVRGAVPRDWWEIPQVQNYSPEYKGYANQIPQALLRRLILTASRPGDLVADPCCGTASTLRTALALGRRAWGCDANPETTRFWGDLQAPAELVALPAPTGVAA